MSKSVLQGLRVLDLTELVAGPYCTRLLAGLGADVVKAEPPEGDRARRLGAAAGDHPEENPLFLFANQGKKSVVLDLESDSGRAKLDDLMRAADVVVESYSPRDSDRLRLRFEHLSDLNPLLVVTSITSFGRSGPYRSYEGDESVACALGGLQYLTGEPDREPLRPSGWQVSYLAGCVATYGTLLALQHRHRSGRGQQVDVSLLESAASILEGSIPAAALGMSRSRHGSKRLDGNPTLIVPCRDGHVVVSLAGEANWEAFGRFIGEERLVDPAYRSANFEMLLADALRHESRAEFFRQAQEWRFPCCSVVEPGELAGDPQHRARRSIVGLNHPLAGRLPYPGAPFRLPATPWRNRRAPLLGEHSLAATLRRWQGRSNLVSHALKTRESNSEQLELSPGALAGTRVLDLTSMWAGPFCTRLLADAGAEVLKIEMPGRPDGTRSGGTATMGGQYSTLFAELNRNKSGLALDLRRREDRNRFFELLGVSDVVVENFSPRVMPNLELDYARLREVKPDLVMLSMPAFGGSGPYRHAVAFGSGIEAMAGLSAVTGYQGGPPELLGVPFGDPVAGLHGAVAVLAALEHRRRTGEGQHIDLAQREALTQFIGEVVVARATAGLRQGNRHLAMAPHGCYRCDGGDRWLAIAVATDRQWVQLCHAIARADLSNDPCFAEVRGRQEHHDFLDDCISQWTRKRDPFEAMRLLQEFGVPAGVVQSPVDLLADEQLRALGLLQRLEDDNRAVYPGPICHLSASPLQMRRPAPKLERRQQPTSKSRTAPSSLGIVLA